MSNEDGSRKSMDDVLSSIRKIMRGGNAKLDDVPAPGSLVEGGADQSAQADEWAMPPGALADPEPSPVTPEADDGTFGLGGNAVSAPAGDDPDSDDDTLELGPASAATPAATDSDGAATGDPAADDADDEDGEALVLGPAMQTPAADTPGPAVDSETVTDDVPEVPADDPTETLDSAADLPPESDEVSDDAAAEDQLDPFAALRSSDDGDDADIGEAAGIGDDAEPELDPEDDPDDEDYIPPPPVGARLGGLSVVPGGFNLGVRSMVEPEPAPEPEPEAEIGPEDFLTGGPAHLDLPDEDLFEEDEPEALPAAPSATELEDAIRTIVRDELSGEFGDRLSSVIRHLIHEEVARALSKRN